jgi:hypothetical protein
VPPTLARLPYTPIAFPTEAQRTTQPKPPTRAQKLAKALKACKKDKPKKQRASCEKQARKHHGAIKNKRK